MTGAKNRGFTIIEILLFLSISGALFVALIAGVSTSINQQRYRDSVTSFAGILQQQYSEVANTRNSRDDNWRCVDSIAEADADAGQGRGTTNCVVLGRYIRTIDNATKLEMGNIIGSEPSGNPVIENDGAALAAYAPRASTFGRVLYHPEWGALLKDKDDHPANFTILVLRSPLSGLVRSFALYGPMPARLIEMMTPEAARQTISTCVVPEGIVLGLVQAVALDANTAGPNAVSVKGDNSEC